MAVTTWRQEMLIPMERTLRRVYIERASEFGINPRSADATNLNLVGELPGSLVNYSDGTTALLVRARRPRAAVRIWGFDIR
jgi:hypothetical protein